MSRNFNRRLTPMVTVATEVAQVTALEVATELQAVPAQHALMVVAAEIASAAVKELQLAVDGDIYDGMLFSTSIASRHFRVKNSVAINSLIESRI